MTRAIFLDRDGTIMEDVGYPRHPDQVTLLHGATDALKRLQQKGYLLVVISNQSGIGRGWVSQMEADSVHERFIELLAKKDVQIRKAYYCPHAPDAGCGCRKPAIGLFQQAKDELGFELSRCVMIGDKSSDVEAGRQAGCRTILFAKEPLTTETTTETMVKAHLIATTWDQAAEWVLREDSPTT